MVDSKSRLEEEKKIVQTMIELYCKNHHSPESALCDECYSLFDYAQKQLDRCLFGEEKPFCSQCLVHCYRPEMREQIRKVMRYSGPRMLFSDTRLALRHLLARFRKPPALEKKGSTN